MHAKRLDALEAEFPPSLEWTPEALEALAPMAADVGITIEELQERTEATMRQAGPPYTLDHVMRYVSRVDGIPLEELQAAVYGRMEGKTE